MICLSAHRHVKNESSRSHQRPLTTKNSRTLRIGRWGATVGWTWGAATCSQSPSDHDGHRRGACGRRRANVPGRLSDPMNEPRSSVLVTPSCLARSVPRTREPWEYARVHHHEAEVTLRAITRHVFPSEAVLTAPVLAPTHAAIAARRQLFAVRRQQRRRSQSAHCSLRQTVLQRSVAVRSGHRHSRPHPSRFA